MIYHLYDYSYNYDGSAEAAVAAGFAGFAVIMMVVGLLLGVLGYLLVGIFGMKMFQKMNISGWKAWVPFVNIWTFLEVAGKPGWLALLPLVESAIG